MKRSTLILAGILVILAIAAYLVLQMPGEESSSGSTGSMLATYDSAAVDKLVIVSGGRAITLVRERDRWWITSPEGARADPASVDSAIARGRRIELKGLVSSNPAKRGVYHVDSTGTMVRVFAGGREQAAFWIGRAGQTFEEAFVRREGSDEVYEAAGPLSWYFAKTFAEWRDHAIVRADRSRISALRYRYGDTTFVVARRDTEWTVGGKPAAPDVVEGVLNSLSAYLATDFVDSAYSAPPPPDATLEFLDTELRFYREPGSQKYMVHSYGDDWYVVEGWRAREVLKREAEFRVR